MDAAEFVDLVRNVVDTDIDLVRIGTVDTVDAGNDRATVRFDGETAASSKQFVALESYSPQAADRVLLLRAGSSWVMLGSLP